MLPRRRKKRVCYQNYCVDSNCSKGLDCIIVHCSFLSSTFIFPDFLLYFSSLFMLTFPLSGLVQIHQVHDLCCKLLLFLLSSMFYRQVTVSGFLPKAGSDLQLVGRFHSNDRCWIYINKRPVHFKEAERVKVLHDVCPFSVATRSPLYFLYIVFGLLFLPTCCTLQLVNQLSHNDMIC